jgi:hypothetical protein
MLAVACLLPAIKARGYQSEITLPPDLINRATVRHAPSFVKAHEHASDVRELVDTVHPTGVRCSCVSMSPPILSNCCVD